MGSRLVLDVELHRTVALMFTLTVHAAGAALAQQIHLATQKVKDHTGFQLNRARARGQNVAPNDLAHTFPLSGRAGASETLGWSRPQEASSSAAEQIEKGELLQSSGVQGLIRLNFHLRGKVVLSQQGQEHAHHIDATRVSNSQEEVMEMTAFANCLKKTNEIIVRLKSIHTNDQFLETSAREALGQTIGRHIVNQREIPKV